jgi:hypothetical protein
MIVIVSNQLEIFFTPHGIMTKLFTGGGSMYKFQCPNCKIFSYSADEFSFIPCPYCGQSFSGMYGTDRRNEIREKTGIPLSVTIHENVYNADIVNSSQEGLCIRAFEHPPITAGDTLSFSIEDSDIHTKVIWNRKDGEKSLLGLQRMN